MALDYSVFPAINATLNGTAAVLIGVGVWLVKSGRRAAHKRAMLAAIASSALFLASYLTYHALLHGASGSASRHFTGTGWIRPVYFAILLSHTILAVVIVPLVLLTVTRGLKARYEAHRSVARWTYPLWLYVSVTGVVIYVMLYHIYA